jgi:hypothetical protein
MRRALLAIALVAAAAPTAHADQAGYRGGCGLASLADVTPGGQLGGQHVWNGAVHLAVVPDAEPATVSAYCELKVNGVDQGTVLSPRSGTGAVLDANTVQYTAAPTDVVSLCTHVQVNAATSVDCADVAGTTVPRELLDALDALAAADASTGPWGMLCGLVSTNDPTGLTDDRQTGEVNAGPLYLGSGSVTCTVQVGDAHYTGANAATASAAGTGAVVLPPTPVSYAGDGTVFVCTQVTVDGDTSAQFLDDATGAWSRDPATARCSAAAESVTLGAARRAPGNGHAYGHEKAKPPNDDDPPPPPPAQPFYPTGTVEIAQSALNPAVAFTYSGFTPALSSWSCTTAGTSTSCTPPPPPAGYVNVCGTVDVSAGDPVPGRITGTSACASGPAAVAAEQFVSTTPTSASASPGTAFPWTCSAAPQGSVTWTVVCSVGP